MTVKKKQKKLQQIYLSDIMKTLKYIFTGNVMQQNFVSLKIKLSVSILTIIIVSNLFLVTFLYKKSRAELINSIQKNNSQFTYSTAV